MSETCLFLTAVFCISNLYHLFSPEENRSICFVPKVIITLIAIVFLFSSCHKKGDNSQTANTHYFDSLITHAEQIYDAGRKMDALAFIISAHAHAKNLSVWDEMNYYTYCADIYKRDLKDYDKYIAYADSIVLALEKADQVKNLHYRYVQAFNMKGDALFAKGLYNEAYENYYTAKKLAKDDSDYCSLSAFSYSLGMVLYKQQKFDDAVNHFMQSYEESFACKDDFIYFYRRQELLDNIGLCYNRQQKYDSAMYYYKKAVAYIDSNYMRFDKNEKVYISAKAVVYGNIADIYIALKQYDTAKQLLTKSIGINIQKGYTNEDALVDQIKLANLYLGSGNINEMKTVLENIKAELDTIPDRQVSLSWNKLMWQYHNHEHDSVSAYRYLLAYMAMNDSFIATNKSLMAVDVDGRIKSLERQYQITLLNKNSEQSQIYMVIAIIIAAMAVIIVLLVLRNASRSKKNIAALTALNNRVNEQKEQLEYALTELELKDKDKSRILRSVAHDVMNPIAAIMSLTDILASEGDDFTPEHKEILSLIKEACTNSLTLSRDILEAAAKLDHASLMKEWVNINKLVANSVELQSIKANAKKQQLIFSADREEIMAYVNKEKIWRIINNLIANAIKFSYENSAIQIILKETDGKVDIAVKDKGIGIPEKNKPYIFDTFTEAKNTGTSGEVPHGLGLSISLQIAKAHKGNIWFESQEGKGTTFHLEFPTSKEAQQG